jgi:TetR/AcrR family transcriptional regulator
MSGEDRRRQLIDVAIDLFSRKGFGGTTTKEIAAAAGVTEAIIFRHFATKQDFYKAILNHKCSPEDGGAWLAEIQKMMDANDDEGLFRFILTKIVSFDREKPQLARLLMHAALEGHELAILHHNQITVPVGEIFKQYIERRQAAGAIRQGDPAVVLYAIAGIAQFAIQKYLYQCNSPALADDEVIETFLAILMNGLKGPGPTETAQ